MNAPAIDQDARLILEQPYGTNDGGWYRDLESGKRKYVKMYANPDQTRVEVLANDIYRHLGIPAAQSRLGRVEGRLAVISDEVHGETYVPFHVLRRSPEVLGGFAADAWLANYDVFGLGGDNVVQRPDGTVVRIDNGGSMQFRARGKKKIFPHNDVPEIATMRDPDVIPMSDPTIAQSTAGRVYNVLSNEAIAAQVDSLARSISPRDIVDLVAEVTFPERETHDFLVRSLVGRRAHLMARFDV